jgi:hypothetical protein
MRFSGRSDAGHDDGGHGNLSGRGIAGRGLAGRGDVGRGVRGRCHGSIDVSDRGDTSRKKGFRSSPLVSKQCGPRLIWALVPVQMKMWARKH